MAEAIILEVASHERPKSIAGGAVCANAYREHIILQRMQPGNSGKKTGQPCCVNPLLLPLPYRQLVPIRSNSSIYRLSDSRHLEACSFSNAIFLSILYRNGR